MKSLQYISVGEREDFKYDILFPIECRRVCNVADNIADKISRKEHTGDRPAFSRIPYSDFVFGFGIHVLDVLQYESLSQDWAKTR